VANRAQPRADESEGFYGIITLATAIGIGIDFAPIDPIKALLWSAMLNGVVAVPIMAVMMRMAVRADIMGTFTITPKLQRLGWFATAVMAIAVVAMLGSLVI
jgi:Mn2+/Fe2+ NRAMP family transporter